MFLQNLKDKDILLSSLNNCVAREGQVIACILDTLQFSNADWQEITVNNSNANEASLANCRIKDSTFYRSSLMNTAFKGCSIDNTVFDGDTLIKTKWLDSRITGVTVSRCTLQRVTMNRCLIKDSSLTDFEGIYAEIRDCVFENCRFAVSPGSGSNSFSGSKFTDCIFIGCSFSGFPLRGVNTDGCILMNNHGEVSDDAECTNSIGLGRFCLPLEGMRIHNREEAMNLISSFNI